MSYWLVRTHDYAARFTVVGKAETDHEAKSEAIAQAGRFNSEVLVFQLVGRSLPQWEDLREPESPKVVDDRCQQCARENRPDGDCFNCRIAKAEVGE